MPEFGGKFVDLHAAQQEAVRKVAQLPESADVDHIHLFRRNGGIAVHVPTGSARNPSM